MRALRTGAVRVDGRKCGGDARLASGSVVMVPWGDATDERRAPDLSVGELDTIYRDDDVWILNKPSGLLAQPDRRGGDSLITRVWGALGWSRNDFRPALVSRLDRNVSGVSIAALASPALRALSESFRVGDVKKIYRAIVDGTPPASGEVDAPLLKSGDDNTVRVDDSGRPSLTRFTTLSSKGGRSLVELELVTGRPHQARVHMAHIGCPIVGDRKYGSADGARRILLHAYSITFASHGGLPAGIRGRSFVAPMPSLFRL